MRDSNQSSNQSIRWTSCRHVIQCVGKHKNARRGIGLNNKNNNNNNKKSKTTDDIKT